MVVGAGEGEWSPIQKLVRSLISIMIAFVRLLTTAGTDGAGTFGQSCLGTTGGAEPTSCTV